MSESNPLKEIVMYQKQGIPKGICSICSSNAYVIEAAMEKALGDNSHVLIEATANQVNQFGGYTGMKPLDFRMLIFSIADKIKFPYNRIILGGDHLGPLTWRDEPAESAMRKAGELIRQYVAAGFNKIHIDTSMHLGGDLKEKPLDTSVIAERGAVLCSTAEEAFSELKSTDGAAVAPVYVIGSEVPIPGGSQEPEDNLKVTEVRDFEVAVQEFKYAFERHGLYEVWENVIAIVVQLGVEFGDETIHEYNRQKAKALCKSLKAYPGLVFEGHSTDYQTTGSLKQMVEDGVAILKVGPELTFALREALFACCHIEEIIFGEEENISHFVSILDSAMLRNPAHWQKYYKGSEREILYKRRYSYSDRCRYYLKDKEVEESLGLLISNLSKSGIPPALISQYFPVQYNQIREGKLIIGVENLIKGKIKEVFEKYSFAAGK